ncbi:LOW QUALITY PROTEIN: putative RNA methyltransferase Y17G7B.18 [Tachypleus tridentatus]|uniref:LOW QUALITY PROTEIN: putative RNA methyltransferase Y17G7B.18 n=1 Tax=Tachypleus tridentatus TaxID=6853 RepID=UPI003FD28805
MFQKIPVMTVRKKKEKTPNKSVVVRDENREMQNHQISNRKCTVSLSQDYNPRKIIGLDIDEQLIRVARLNVRHYITAELSKGAEFPISMLLCHVPIAAAALPGRQDKPSHFPNNVFFIQGNYVLESDELLEAQQPEFDCILCLSLTKWIHLNWGDEGLKRVFQRMYAQLQSWRKSNPGSTSLEVLC